MKNLFKKWGLGFMMDLLVIVAALAVSWICTCGIIYLITLCFSLKFNWLIATGIWLITLMARSIFKTTVNTKK